MPAPGNQTPSTATSAASGGSVTAATATATATVTVSTNGTELTAEEADAQLSSQTVKPYVTLGNGGSNFHSWNKMLLSQARIKRCQRGTEFLNQEFRSFCLAQGIEMETSAPATPQQNGTAERMNRTLKERVRTLLAAAQAKQSLWKEALQAAVLLCNIVPTSNRSVTPYEAFLGIKPTAAALRT
jgi:transposase InsO family protein